VVWCIGCNIQQVHIPSLSFHLQVHPDLYKRRINSKHLQLITFLLTTAMLICREHTHSIFAPPPSRSNTTAYAACILQRLPNQVCHNNRRCTNRGIFFISNKKHNNSQVIVNMEKQEGDLCVITLCESNCMNTCSVDAYLCLLFRHKFNTVMSSAHFN
jgi:hypothetical protein